MDLVELAAVEISAQIAVFLDQEAELRIRVNPDTERAHSAEGREEMRLEAWIDKSLRTTAAAQARTPAAEVRLVWLEQVHQPALVALLLDTVQAVAVAAMERELVAHQRQQC